MQHYIRRAILVAGVVVACLVVAGPDAASAQSAKGVFYDCDMRPSKANEFWISSKIGIVMLKDGSIIVSDGVSLYYPGGTAKATLRQKTEREMRLEWHLKGGLKKSNGREVLLLDAEYTATIEKPSNRIRVRGWLPGHRARFSGRGICTLRDK